MPKEINKQLPSRAGALIIVCILAWIVWIVRLGLLQIVDYEKYKASVIDNVQRETEVAARRGTIYDRNMTPLATNATVWRIFISPRDIPDDVQAALIAENLSRILSVDYDTILERAGRKTRADETIKRNVEEAQANEVLKFIEENNLDNQIYLEASSKRYYPYGSLAAQVIGTVGTDGGAFGLELQYDTDLKGVPGRYITARTGVGKRMPFKYDSYTEAKNGVNIVTTLDVTMQYLLENQLEKTFVDSEANNRVTGIIMDVNTGAVLAMATYPNFDLNTPFVLDKYSQVKLDESGYVYDTQEYNDYYMNLVYSMWKNKAVSELYEPGSTFKIITASMALEEKVVSTDDKFTCTGAYFVSGYNKPIHCHLRSGHGTVTFVTGFQQSCNPTFMQVAERIGREKFYSYFNAFGFTEKTGIDLPGEASSIFHDYSGFNQVELAVYSFGQTFKCTPLQQLTAISSVANGGSLLTPHMVSSFIDDNGNTLKTFDTEIKRQVISADTGRTISTILEEGVAGNGGAKNAYVAGYKIAAKTGTSEVRDMLNAAGESYLRVGSCVAFAPSDDPQIAAIIIVDQPQIKSVYGSIVAAPYIANLFNELLPSIGIERSYTDAEMAKLNVTVPKFTGWPLEDAIQNLTNVKGIKYEVIGTPSPDGGDVVKYQIPAAGEIMSKDTGKLLLYIGDAIVENYVMVPDLKGYSAGTANTRLANAGLNIHIDGSANYDVVNGAVVTSQTPAAYENVPRGTVVTITLRYLDGTE